ncbi:MAG: DoxX family protein [Gemmatimonadota bacterium]
MATYVQPAVDRRVAPRDSDDVWPRPGVMDWARYLVPLGRALFAAIFLGSVSGLVGGALIGYATQAGVPFPNILVPLAGIVAAVGGLSVLLGFHARAGAWVLIAFLVPVTFMMHAFWTVTDPAMRAMQQANFMKNVALVGAALMIAYWGAGPLSLDLKRLWRLHS